jgi:hypothetical protein
MLEHCTIVAQLFFSPRRKSGFWRKMKFATVDGRTAWVDAPVGGLSAFRGDVCDVLDVCPTYIFTNMGRIVIIVPLVNRFPQTHNFVAHTFLLPRRRLCFP